MLINPKRQAIKQKMKQMGIKSGKSFRRFLKQERKRLKAMMEDKPC